MTKVWSEVSADWRCGVADVYVLQGVKRAGPASGPAWTDVKLRARPGGRCATAPYRPRAA